MEKIRPMLGNNAVLDKIQFPVYASPKLDGVRAIITEEGVMSRSGKPIPNRYVQKLFRDYVGFDGELIVGSPTASDVFNRTTSGVMSKDGEPNVILYVFDYWKGEFGIYNRYRFLKNKGLEQNSYYGYTFLIEQKFITTSEELAEYEAEQLAKGYEGIMIRNPEALYKHGRSTVKEGGLLKVKRFVDGEAIVIGYEPLLKNNNKAEKDELGYTKRSTAAEGKEALPLLGNLLVKDCKTGVEFSIGSGFTQQLRALMWETRDNLIGCTAKYKHFPVGEMDKPRFPIFLGFRAKEDMDNE